MVCYNKKGWDKVEGNKTAILGENDMQEICAINKQECHTKSAADKTILV